MRSPTRWGTSSSGRWTDAAYSPPSPAFVQSTTTAQSPLRVALVTLGSVSDQAWNSGAYQGLLTLRDSLGAQVSNVQTKTPAFMRPPPTGTTDTPGHPSG